MIVCQKESESEWTREPEYDFQAVCKEFKGGQSAGL